MPNNNPAGSNQPLDKHPVPYPSLYSLGQDSLIFDNLNIAGSPYAIVPAPPEGVTRLVTDVKFALVNGAADDAIVTVSFQDANGTVLLATQTLGAADDIEDVPANIFLTSEDTGLIAAVTDDSAGNVVCAASWYDVRDVSRQDTELTAAFQNITPVVPLGSTMFFPLVGEEFDNTGCKILNHDGAVAVTAAALRITDGTTTIELTDTLAAVVNGSVDLSIALRGITLPYGWAVQAATGVGAFTEPVIASIPYRLTNLGPVRSDQGGAY